MFSHFAANSKQHHLLTSACARNGRMGSARGALQQANGGIYAVRPLRRISTRRSHVRARARAGARASRSSSDAMVPACVDTVRLGSGASSGAVIELRALDGSELVLQLFVGDDSARSLRSCLLREPRVTVRSRSPALRGSFFPGVLTLRRR